MWEDQIFIIWYEGAGPDEYINFCSSDSCLLALTCVGRLDSNTDSRQQQHPAVISPNQKAKHPKHSAACRISPASHSADIKVDSHRFVCWIVFFPLVTCCFSVQPLSTYPFSSRSRPESIRVTQHSCFSLHIIWAAPQFLRSQGEQTYLRNTRAKADWVPAR